MRKYLIIVVSVVALLVFAGYGYYFILVRQFDTARQACIEKFDSYQLTWTIALKPQTPATQATALRDALSNIDGVDRVQILSSEEALQQYKETLAGDSQALKTLSQIANPFGPQVIIVFKKEVEFAAKAHESAIRIAVVRLSLTPESISYKNSGMDTVIARVPVNYQTPSVIQFLDPHTKKEFEVRKYMLETCEPRKFADDELRERPVQIGGVNQKTSLQ